MRHLFIAQLILVYTISTGLAGCGHKAPPIPKPPTIPLEEAKV